MEQYLLDIALEGAALYRNTADFEAGICLRGTDLENMIAEFEQSKSVIERLSLVIDRAALLAIASGVEVDLSDMEKHKPVRWLWKPKSAIRKSRSQPKSMLKKNACASV